MATEPKVKNFQKQDAPSILIKDYRIEAELLPQDGVDPRNLQAKEYNTDNHTDSDYGSTD